MPRQVAFGIRLPNSGPFASRRSILEIARAAERLGYHSVWVHDHLPWSQRTNFAAGAVEIVDPRTPPPFFESLTTLAFVAGATQRLQLGTAAVVLPLRDPRVLAKQVATLHQLSGRRLILGLAVGAVRRDFEILQVAWAERGALMDEHLAALTAILSSPQASAFRGARVQFDGAEFFPNAPDLPVWFCGMSRPAFRRLARFGQGWLPAYPSVAEYRERMKALEEALAERSRTLDGVTAGLETFVCVAESRDRAIQISRATLLERFKSLEAGLARTLVGGAEDVRDRVGAYVAAGASFFELKFICASIEDMLGMLGTIAEAVVPAFRDGDRTGGSVHRALRCTVSDLGGASRRGDLGRADRA
jgi:probable F420-dependent oxidoreductase